MSLRQGKVYLRGEVLPVRHEAGRGLTRVEDGVLRVTGDAAFIRRRVRDFMIGEARKDIVPQAMQFAKELDVRLRRITLKDTSSRWGSCTEDGALAFSWRLIMAPPEVLSYVVAHEVAHRREMNHSPRFWAVVAELYPNHLAPRKWLKKHGGELHRFKF